MRRVEQTIASVGGALPGELVVREAKYNGTEVCVTGECLVETVPGNALALDDAGNYHDADSGM